VNRLSHHAHRITLTAESLRKLGANTAAAAKPNRATLTDPAHEITATNYASPPGRIEPERVAQLNQDYPARLNGTRN